MSKKIKGSYLLNAVGVALVFALLTGLFAANAFGTSTTYIQGCLLYTSDAADD